MKRGRPINPLKVKRAVQLIERIGLEVIGPCVNLDSGEVLCANMSFNPTRAARYSALRSANKLWRREEY